MKREGDKERRKGTRRRNGKMKGGERKLEGGGKCQMVGLRHSVSPITERWILGKRENNMARSEIT